MEVAPVAAWDSKKSHTHDPSNGELKKVAAVVFGAIRPVLMLWEAILVIIFDVVSHLDLMEVDCTVDHSSIPTGSTTVRMSNEASF